MIRPDDEFFIGYLDRAPGGVGRFVARAAAAIVVGAAVLAALVALVQAPLPAAFFEFGTVREFHGVWARTPYPVLAVRRPGTTLGTGDISLLTLVGEGKHGLREGRRVDPGAPVRLHGTLIYRDDQAMIEVASGSIHVEGPAHGDPVPPVDEGRVTLRGELVDAKCFMGVMNPGNGVPHRACAIRCLSGGIPPLLAVRDSVGVAAYVWLASAEGAPLEHRPWAVARPIAATGRLVRQGDALILFTDPGGLRLAQ